MGRLYQHAIVQTGKEAEFLILVAFLITFTLVRIITHAIRRGRRGRALHDLVVGQLHIHHLVWGILLLLTTGYLALAFDSAAWRPTLAILFGVGAALTLDEFALWLNLEDVYWAKQGRWSVDAVIITSTLFALMLLGQDLWIGIARLLGGFLGLI